eukprot:146728-Pelagomonas_calceolata.AAC.1
MIGWRDTLFKILNLPNQSHSNAVLVTPYHANPLLLLPPPPPPPPPPHIMCYAAGTAPHRGPARLLAYCEDTRPGQQLEAAQQHRADLSKNLSGTAVTNGTDKELR